MDRFPKKIFLLKNQIVTISGVFCHILGLDPCLYKMVTLIWQRKGFLIWVNFPVWEVGERKRYPNKGCNQKLKYFQYICADRFLFWDNCSVGTFVKSFFQDISSDGNHNCGKQST